MTCTDAQLAAVRLEAIGNSRDATTLADEDIEWFWSNGGEGDVTLTAACVLDMLANRLAITTFKWTADGQSIDKTMQPAALRERATELRRRYYGSGTTNLTRAEDVDDAWRTEYSR